MKNPRIKRLIKTTPDLTELEIVEELRKEKSEEELHKLSEIELMKLIISILARLRVRSGKGKMKKEVKQIYI